MPTAKGNSRSFVMYPTDVAGKADIADIADMAYVLYYLDKLKKDFYESE